MRSEWKVDGHKLWADGRHTYTLVSVDGEYGPMLSFPSKFFPEGLKLGDTVTVSVEVVRKEAVAA